MSVAEKYLTAEQYRQMPDEGVPTELVRGEVVRMNVPSPRHGEICSEISRILGNFVKQHDLGRVVCNDAGVITGRNPDTVRGADVAYYSYDRVPKGPLPAGYLPVVPELVFEVRSPDDRWPPILIKVAEYLDAGVAVVCVVDPQSQGVHVYRADQPVEVLTADQQLALPDLLGEFRTPVQALFG